jgi:hypothetical protein
MVDVGRQEAADTGVEPFEIVYPSLANLVD